MVIALKNLSKKIIFSIFSKIKNKMNCLSLCESINATCQAACNADMGCLQECSREFIDCTSFCPQAQCDVSSLSLEEKIKLDRSLGWSLYDAKSEINWWKDGNTQILNPSKIAIFRLEIILTTFAF